MDRLGIDNHVIVGSHLRLITFSVASGITRRCDNNVFIFDYIPPQKTNQIFTPKRVVKMMVDELEKQNPGCFDDPTKTFADLYMKSGLYITEIVKRLYNSTAMKAAIPDDKARVRHILQKQVYGMAPTRIIYLIATNYILGFD